MIICKLIGWPHNYWGQASWTMVCALNCSFKHSVTKTQYCKYSVKIQWTKIPIFKKYFSVEWLWMEVSSVCHDTGFLRSRKRRANEHKQRKTNIKEDQGQRLLHCILTLMNVSGRKKQKATKTNHPFSRYNVIELTPQEFYHCWLFMTVAADTVAPNMYISYEGLLLTVLLIMMKK